MSTSIQSRKAKGRNLQKRIVQLILSLFPSLTPRDVQSCSMGNSGVDIQLSEAAHRLWPWACEAKNQEVHAAFIKAWEQTTLNTPPDSRPLLVIHANRLPALAILKLEHFMDLCKHE
jgi:hypothetical protein